jgi:C4-dicarboxylate-specific signal transduction histidine kinase
MNSIFPWQTLWRFSDWQIRTKLTIAFLLLALAPLALITLYVNGISRNALLIQGAVSLQDAGRSTAQALDGVLAEQSDFIRVVGLMPEVVRYAQNQNDPAARAAAQLVLVSAVQKSPEYESIAIIRPDGRISLSTNPDEVGSDLNLHLYFTQALKGESYVSDPDASPISGQPMIFYSAPIKDTSGSVRAVVRSTVNMDSLWDLVEKDQNIGGTGSFSTLLDENGIRIADSNSRGNRQAFERNLLFRAIAPLPASVEKTLLDEQRFGKSSGGVQVVPLPEIAARMSSGEPGVFTTRSDINNAQNQAVIVSLAYKPWRYVLSSPNETYTAPADMVTLFAAIVAVVLAVIVIGLSIALSRNITRPLLQLTRLADQISLGEFDVQVQVDRRDEIGQLAKAVARMQVSLQAAITRLRARHSTG